MTDKLPISSKDRNKEPELTGESSGRAGLGYADTLMECPFCGGEAYKDVITQKDSYDSHWVECDKCGATISECGIFSESEAIKRWNTRVARGEIWDNKDFTSACCVGKRCSMCGEPAAFKVGEEIFHDDPNPYRHNLTAYVCKKHFEQIMDRDRFLRREIVKDTPQSGYHTISVHAKLPDYGQSVIVPGGVARYEDGKWYSQVDAALSRREIQWPVTWWMPIPIKPSNEIEVQEGKNEA